MNIEDIKWYDALEAQYGSALSDNQVEVWQAYLRDKNASNEELRSSIEMAAGNDVKTEEWRVTVRDLSRWLDTYRKCKRDKTKAEDKKRRIDAFVVEWREKIARGASKDDLTCAIERLGFRGEMHNDVYDRVMG